MRILMILDREFPPDTRVENEINTLLEAGHHLSIACYTRKNLPEEDFYSNARVYRKPIPDFIYKSSVGALKFPFYFNFWRKFIWYVLKREPFDAVHVHDLPLALIGAELKKAHNLAFILDLHECWPAYLRMTRHTKTLLGRMLSSHKQWIRYEKAMCVAADRIIVVIEEARERLAKMGIPESKVHLVQNTLKLENFKRQNETPTKSGPFIMVYAGDLTFVRGIQDVIKAFRMVTKKIPEAGFWIIGDGSYKKYLQHLTVKLHLAKSIIFFGWKPFREMAELMNQADISVIPHKKSEHTDHTIPHKLFQSMYAGKPVLASNCEPLERIIMETKSGLIFQDGNIDDIADKILEMSEMGEAFQHMKENGYMAVINRYNWDMDAKTLVTLYDGIQ